MVLDAAWALYNDTKPLYDTTDMSRRDAPRCSVSCAVDMVRKL